MPSSARQVCQLHPVQSRASRIAVVDKYILAGRLPRKPFINKTVPITGIGSSLPRIFPHNLLAAGYNVLECNLISMPSSLPINKSDVYCRVNSRQIEPIDSTENEFRESLGQGSGFCKPLYPTCAPSSFTPCGAPVALMFGRSFGKTLATGPITNPCMKFSSTSPRISCKRSGRTKRRW